MPLQRWTYDDQATIADEKIFRLLRLRSSSPRTGLSHRFSVLEAADWVNVVALTPDQEVVLVRQFRHGIRDFTLEIPGGMVDAGETPAQAASRELREESGYAGDPPIPLGVVTPNPAFLNNHCHTYLLENCRRTGAPQLDQGEDLEVLTLPLSDIPGIVATRAIDHALVICAFWWLVQRYPSRFRPQGT